MLFLCNCLIKTDVVLKSNKYRNFNHCVGRLIKTDVVLKLQKGEEQKVLVICLIKTDVVLKLGIVKRIILFTWFNKNRCCIEIFNV